MLTGEDIAIMQMERMEYDPNGKSPKDKGSKLDAGKSPVFQGLLDYFPRACLEVAKISQQGASKYSWKGWEDVPDGVNRYKDAGARHLVNETIEGRRDSEGFRHLGQTCWNFLAAFELQLRKEEDVHF